LIYQFSIDRFSQQLFAATAVIIIFIAVCADFCSCHQRRAGQGDQIGRFFAYWGDCLPTLGFGLKNCKSIANFEAFFHSTSNVLILAKEIGWATFWATFPQTHPVTLIRAVTNLNGFVRNKSDENRRRLPIHSNGRGQFLTRPWGRNSPPPKDEIHPLG
jgi:hypothetical protein